MEISYTEDGAFLVSTQETHLVDFLLAIGSSTDPRDHPGALQRLFPDPVRNDSEASADWKEYIQPELAGLFRSARETVEGDLAPLREGKEGFEIPASHVDAWLNTLNQARLALAARFDIDEETMEKPISPILENEREIALFQIHLYGFLQECLIRGE